MLSTRIRLTGSLLFVAACALAGGAARPDEKDKVPAPKNEPPVARKEFEAKLVGRSADELKPLVERLSREWISHKGAVEVAAGRLALRTEEAAKARQQANDLKAPPAGPLTLQPDDAAIKAEQARADYLGGRVRTLGAVQTALTAVSGARAELSRVAQAANEHLFQLRAVATAATKAGVNDLPAAATPKALDDAAGQLRSRLQEATAATEKAKTDLGAVEKELAEARAETAATAARIEALKAAQADAVAAGKYENEIRLMNLQQLAAEVANVQKVLTEKTAATAGDARDFNAAVAAATDARAALKAVKEPLPPGAEPFTAATQLPQAVEKLIVAQQYLAARLRTADEIADKTKALAVALDELERKAVAYSSTLEDALRATSQLRTLATEVGRRVATGDLDPAKAPDATANVNRDALTADARAVAKSLAESRQERDELRKPDPDAENVRNLTTQIHARVSERLARLSELKKLAADAGVPYKDRTEAEKRRLDQRAAERLAREGKGWDRALAFDRSKPALDAADLLASYYRELIEADDLADNIKHQKDDLEQLVELTQREAGDLAKLHAVLAREAKPSPETRKWDEWLTARLAPSGLRAEASAYQSETAKLNALVAGSARRVEALTGNAAPTDPAKAAEQTKLAASGGEIGGARAELQAARLRGLQTTGIKIGLILLAALLVPFLLLRVLRRAIRGGTDDAGNPSPVLAVLRSGLKAATWVAAVALILSVLGYDVTALVIALAIGALAVALAARPMIADLLGSVVIFAERRFKVGDVVRLGDGEAARVVGITWRSTALKAPNGLVFSVPNRKVTESTLENLSKGTETYDTLAVTVSTDKDAGKVIGVIRGAVGQCKNVSADNGVTVMRYVQKGSVKVVEYRFWWFLKDYETRNKTRDEVFARIALGLANEDMTGIEVTLG